MSRTGVSFADQLQHDGVAGHIVTTVGSVHRNARVLVAGDPEQDMGLRHLLPALLDELMAGLEALTGARVPPEGPRSERVWVDPDVVAAQCREAARRLHGACETGDKVLFGTGHPAGPIDLYSGLAEAMGARGAQVLVFAEGEPLQMDGYGLQVRWVGDVACLGSGGDLLHTHSALPMERLLEVGPAPDLVVGDHGFVGAALTQGSDAVALVDANDPALILAWVRGMPIWPILCDDHRPPSNYDALLRYLVQHLPAL